MIKPARISYCILIASFLAMFGACERDDSASTTTQRSTSSPSSAPATRDAAPDESLTASEYIALGMPAHDREWLGQDMAVAASTLQALAAKSPERLPRFRSNRSGPVFSRIVAKENLNALRSQALPLSLRFPQGLQFLESSNAILKVYISARLANKVTGDELVELMGAQLRVVHVALDLVDEFLPTLSPDDPKHPARMAGLEQMRQGLAGIVSGAITTLTESDAYEVSTRARLLAYCRETLPSIVPKLTAPSQQEMLRRLDELVDDGSVRDLRPQIIALRDEVYAATKTRG